MSTEIETLQSHLKACQEELNDHLRLETLTLLTKLILHTTESIALYKLLGKEHFSVFT